VDQCQTWWSPCRTEVVPSAQRSKVWLTPTTWLPCSNAAKTRKPLKLAGVPQTTGPISAASRPKFTILWDICRRYCCLTSFFPIVDTCLRCEDIARRSCMMVRRWRFFGDFLRPAFSVSHVQHVSDLHPKFALRPHQTSNLRPLTLGEEIKKEERKKEETGGQKYNGLPYSIGRP